MKMENMKFLFKKNKIYSLDVHSDIYMYIPSLFNDYSSATKLFSATWLFSYTPNHWLIFNDPIESRH